MKLYAAFKRALGMAPVLHPVDGGLAKRWIKQRLLAVFPELRGNPKALEAAYRALSLEPRPGGPGDEETVFELRMHRDESSTELQSVRPAGVPTAPSPREAQIQAEATNPRNSAIARA